VNRIYCDINLFDLYQKVYIINPSLGLKECVTVSPMEELPEVINAVSNEKNIKKILLTGNAILCDSIAQDITVYNRKNYSQNNIEIEVLK
jgi:hypothetical protein